MQYAGHLEIFIPKMMMLNYDVTASGAIRTIGIIEARGTIGAISVIDAIGAIGISVAEGIIRTIDTSGAIGTGCADAEQIEMLR